MKIRQGFVSNSSSSSFVLVVSVADHVKACNQLSVDDQDAMNMVMEDTKPQCVGAEDVIVITGGDYEDYWNRGHYSNDDVDAPEGQDYWDYQEKAKEFWDNYLHNLPKGSFVEEWSDR